MDLDAFRTSLSAETPPDALNHALQALWWDAKGAWDHAHACAQAEENASSAWAHAYLHRKEGDLANASYWYRKAGRPVASSPLEHEWATIAEALLQADRT